MHTLEKDLVALTRDGADTAMEEEEVEPITMIHLSTLAIRAGTLAYQKYWKNQDMTACDFVKGGGWNFIKEEAAKELVSELVRMGLKCDVLERVYMGLALTSALEAARGAVAPAGQE